VRRKTHPFFFVRGTVSWGGMKSFRTLMLLLAPLMLLAGCSDSGGDSAKAGGLTADDSEQLNDAAAMLDVGERPALPTNVQAP